MHASKSLFLKLLPACLLLLALGARAASSLESRYAFNIPAQSVATALLTFAEQAKTQVMTSSVDLKNLNCGAVTGEKTVKQALEQILRGTGLKYEVVADNAIAIQSPRKPADGQAPPIAFRLTQADAPTTVARAQETAAVPAPDKDAKTTDGDNEMMVLGSRIRRTDAGPSPNSVYDEEYIRATGALNLADFLNRLPQNYAGISAGRGSALNELNPDVGQRTEDTLPLTSTITGGSSAPPGQTGVSGVSLRGLGSGSTLVLVDGRRVVQSGMGNRSTNSQQGFVDINTIPLAMVERIEVITDGASALYGADAVAGVINIITKKNWSGGELSTNHKGTFEGGGQERSASLSYGFNVGALRGNFTFQGYDRDALKASERDFSAEQNHLGRVVGRNADGTPIMGRDLRLIFGYPGVIQAQTGNLNGITGPNGLPTRFAIVRPGVTGAPTIADFIGALPGQTQQASYIVRGNTAPYIDLIPESTRYGASTNFSLPIGDAMEAYTSYSFNDVRGLSNTQPAIASAGTSNSFGNNNTIIPASMNPFNQPILVGMIHDEFGSIWQRTHTKAHSATLGMRGVIGSWRWDSAVGYQKQIYDQLQRAFNGSALSVILTDPNPAQRLNPFLDSRVTGGTQAAIYERTAIYPTRNAESDMKSWDLSADGELFDLPGGTVRMAAGTFFERNTNENYVRNITPSTTPTPNTTSTAVFGGRESYGAFSELALPLFGKDLVFPGLQRLEFQFAARYEDRDEAGSTMVPKYGIAWVPVESLLVRASFSEGFRAPALTEYQLNSATNPNGSITTDPLRPGVGTTTGVTIVSGANPDLKPETSTTQFYGLVFQPAWAPGLDLDVSYYLTEQKNAIQLFSAQRVVNNEAFFGEGRVIRAAPTQADINANRPGAITRVNASLINFGKVTNASMDFGVNYRLPYEGLGTFRVSLNASRTMAAERELAPNVPAIDDEGDTLAPPKWRYNVYAFWNRGPWNGSAFMTYMSGFRTNGGGNNFTLTHSTPSQTNIDLRGGYTFDQGLWRGMAKNSRLSFGIGNVLGEDPPFADTIFGFNGGLASPLGRTYELQLMLPF